MTSKIQALFLSTFLLVVSLGSLWAKEAKTLLFVGTYTDAQPTPGIYVYEFNSRTGELTPVASGEGLINPSFLDLSPNGKYLYACTHTQLQTPGKLQAFLVDSISGKLTPINAQSVGGRNPVHVNVHPSGAYVAVASYTDPGVALFQCQADGSLMPRSQLIEFVDKSINESRQENAHLHSAYFSFDGTYLYVPDLGGDKIRAFTLKKGNEPGLLVNDVLTVKSTPGSGPRHMAFHPGQKYVYVVEELSGHVAAYAYKEGGLTLIDRYFCYSKKQPDYGSADIHITRDGRFLYVSNRLHDENTLGIFKIDADNGTLTLVGHSSTYGERPRNFTIDPSDNFVLVANVSSNNVVVLKRNPKTGMLENTGHEIQVHKPSCLVMRTYQK